MGLDPEKKTLQNGTPGLIQFTQNVFVLFCSLGGVWGGVVVTTASVLGWLVFLVFSNIGHIKQQKMPQK